MDSTSHTHNTLSRSLQDWCLAWPERSCRTQLKSISPERPLPTTVSAKHPLSPSLSICILMILPILKVWSLDEEQQLSARKFLELQSLSLTLDLLS